MEEKHPLRIYRDRSGESLEDLARKCGTTRATLSRIENGLQNPSLALMERIRNATGGALRADDFLPFRPENACEAGAIADGETTKTGEVKEAAE